MWQFLSLFVVPESQSFLLSFILFSSRYFFFNLILFLFFILFNSFFLAEKSNFCINFLILNYLWLQQEVYFPVEIINKEKWLQSNIFLKGRLSDMAIR